MVMSYAGNTSQGVNNCHTGGISRSIQSLAGNNAQSSDQACLNMDNREYLTGFFTFPKNGTFGMNMEPLTSTKVNNWQLQCKAPNVKGTDGKCYKACKKLDLCDVESKSRVACPGKDSSKEDGCNKLGCCYDPKVKTAPCYKKALATACGCAKCQVDHHTLRVSHFGAAFRFQAALDTS